MADVNAKIGVQIDTSAALAELKALQRQLANFHSSVAKGSAASAAAQKNLQYNLLNSINSTGKFYAQMGLVRTSTESFTHALEKNKLSMREYFRYAGGASKTFGRLFKQEFDTIGKVAEERVKRMSTQYIKMGRDASGAMKAMSITPTTLNMKDYGTQVALAAQRQALFNQLLKQGSTNLLNFGKNTQWAGRQLMVGFTIPLAYFGTAASKTFMDLEKQAIKFRRVYGDIFTTTEETDKALADIQKLAQEFTKYGVAVVDTMEMAAQAAAMGKTGAELTAQVAEATRLAVLGGVEQAKALETTISVTNAFGISADDLRKKIDFLNAVENQTVVSIEDLTEAIPKAGPVVKQLGGSVEDLAFFLTAMKEGGINASEGANALKSGLASLINPSDKAAEMLSKMGVNIKAIVEGNAGNLKETVIDFALALDTLDPLNRSRAIEQLFGKFQFARLSTLFQNITKDGTQASRVLDLAGASVEELAILSERELKKVENAVGVNFKESVEKLKVTLAPIGKIFLQTITPLIETLGKVFEKFDGLSEGTKKFIIVAGTLIGGVGPILLMTFGLVANAIANIVKLFVTMRTGFLKAGTTSKVLADQTQYLSSEQLEAATVATSLNQAHNRLTQSFNAETVAIQMLRQAYIDATSAAARFAATNPGMMGPGFRGFGPKKLASGTTGVIGGTPGKDSVPSLLMPGEAVIPTKIAQDDRFKPLVESLVTGKIAKYGTGTTGVEFENKVYNAKSAVGAKNIKTFLDSLIKNSDGTLTYIDPKTREATTFSNQRLREVLAYRSQTDQDFSASKIKKSLVIGSGSRGTGKTSNSQAWIKTLTKQANYPNMLAEQQAIESALAKNGISLKQSQKDNLFQKQASHITPEFDAQGNKIFKASNIVPDSGWVNNYLNTVKGKLGKNLLSMTDAQLNQLGIDRNELKSLVDQKHPRTGKAAGTLANIAKYHLTQDPKNYQAQSVIAGMDYRAKSKYYPASGAIKTLAEQFPNNPKVIKEITEQVAARKGEAYITNSNKTGIVSGQTGRPKPSGLQSTKSPSDTRMMPTYGLSKILPMGIKGPRLIQGAVGGWDSETVAGGKPFTQTASGLLVPQSALIESLDKNTKIQEDGVKTNSETNKTAKEARKQQRQARADRISRVSGPLSMVAGTAAMAGYMTGNAGVGNVAMGVSGLAMLAPMLANPMGAVAAGLTAIAASALLVRRAFDKAQDSAIKMSESMGNGNEAINNFAMFAGKVSAGEVMDRRRKNLLGLYPVQPGKTTFGQNFVKSEGGKAMVSNVGKTIKNAGYNVAQQQVLNQLATGIASGALDPAQARSIAANIASELGDYSFGINVNAKLIELFGPNGENLAKDPLSIRMRLIQDSRKNLSKQTQSLYNAGGLNQGRKGNMFGVSDAFQIGGSVAAGAGAGALTGAVIGSVVPVIGTAIGAAVGSVVGAISGGIIGRKGRMERIGAASGATVSMQKSALEQSQQMQDSLRLEYEKRIQVAKAAGDTAKAIKLQGDYQKANAVLLKENATLISDIENTYKNSSGAVRGALETGIDKQITAKYKGTAMADIAPLATSLLGDSALSKEQQFTIKMQLASGQMDPMQIVKLMESFGQDKEILTKVMNIVTKFGGAFANDITTITSLFVDKEGKPRKDIQTKFIAKINDQTDPAVAERMKNFFAQVASTGEVLDVTVQTEFLLNNPEVANKLMDTFDKLNALKGKIDFEVASKILNADQVSALADDLDHFNNIKTDQQKKIYLQTLIQTLSTVSPDDPALKSWLQTDGQAWQNDPPGTQLREYAQWNARQLSATAIPNVIPNGTDTGLDSGKRDTTFDDILINLKRTRDATIDTTKGAQELIRVLGGNKDLTMFKGIDQQLASLGSNTDFIDFVGGLEKAIQNKIIKISKQGVVSLTELGKAAKKAYNEKQIGLFQAEQINAIKGAQAQRGAFLKLTEAGASSAEALELVADAQFAIAINSQTSREEIDKVVNSLKIAKKVAEETSRLNDPIGGFRDDMEKANKLFDLRERQARAKYQPEIDRVNKLIDSTQDRIDKLQSDAEMQFDRPIQALQDESRALNHDLTLISQASDKINEKYDKQKEALESIYSINERIAQQQKSRITLADALTQGDISAAAQAAQDIRNQSQEYAQQDSLAALERARQNELGALTSASGLTKLQIEERLSQIAEQTYDLETKRQEVDKQILKLQDEIYSLKQNQLKVAEDALKAELDAIEAQRAKWEEASLAIDSAEANAEGYSDLLLKSEETLKRMAELWKSMGAGITATAAKGAITGPLGGGTGATSAAAAFGYTDAAAYRSYRAGERMYGGLIRRYDVGGIVAGSGMTDKVPSLLTPGEYVVNKAATQRFGPLLEQINESKYPGSLSLGGTPAVVGLNNNMINNNSTSVYNYSLQVDVNGSSASPDDIARTVIAQIRNMDAQRLRGNKY